MYSLNSWRTIVIGGLLVAIFAVYNIFSNVAFFAVGLGALVLTLFYLDFKQLFLLYVFLTPSVMMIKLAETPFAILGYFLILILIKTFIVKKQFVFPRYMLLVCIFAVITFCVYWQISLILTLVRNVAFFMLAYYCICFEPSFRSNAAKRDVLYMFFLGVLANLLAGFAYGFIDGSLMSGHFSGIRNDRNYFSTILLMGIALGIMEIVNNKKNFVWNCLGVMLCVSGGILSNSRTFFIGLVIVVFIAIPYLINPKYLHYCVIIGIIACCGAYYFREPLGESFTSLISRFEDDDVSDGNGRFSVWLFYLSSLMRSPITFLFGNGNASAYVELGLVEHVEHNSYIELLSTYGAFGFVARLLVGGYLFYEVWIQKRNVKGIKLLNCIPLLAVLVCFSGVSGGTSDQFNLCLLISCWALVYFPERERADFLTNRSAF